MSAAPRRPDLVRRAGRRLAEARGLAIFGLAGEVTLKLAEWLLIGLAIASIVGFLIGLWTDDVALRLATKPVPVLVALLVTAGRAHGAFAWWVVGGLSISILGDVLLEIPADLFVFGLGAFLLAHVAFIGAALSDERRLKPWLAIPFVLWCGGAYAALFSGMGDLAAPVAVYVTVIATMMWRMAARVDGTLGAWLGVGGALVFAASDTVIAIRKFGVPFSGDNEVIILTYWIGQAGIAASAVLASQLRSGGADVSNPSQQARRPAR